MDTSLRLHQVLAVFPDGRERTIVLYAFDADDAVYCVGEEWGKIHDVLVTSISTEDCHAYDDLTVGRQRCIAERKSEK